MASIASIGKSEQFGTTRRGRMVIYEGMKAARQLLAGHVESSYIKPELVKKIWAAVKSDQRTFDYENWDDLLLVTLVVNVLGRLPASAFEAPLDLEKVGSSLVGADTSLVFCVETRKVGLRMSDEACPCCGAELRTNGRGIRQILTVGHSFLPLGNSGDWNRGYTEGAYWNVMPDDGWRNPYL